MQPDYLVCPNCGKSLEVKESAQSPAVAQPTGPPPRPKRPGLLSALLFFWTLGGLYNIGVGLNTVNTDYGTLSYLCDPSVPQWFQFGVPAELALSFVVFLLGLGQLVSVYGIFRKKSWTYKLVLFLPILGVIVASSLAWLYASAPSSLGLFSSQQVILAGYNIVWLILIWWYARRPNVREFLNVSAPVPTIH